MIDKALRTIFLLKNHLRTARRSLLLGKRTCAY